MKKNSDETILALKALIAQPGWAIITRICKGNIKYLASQIIEKRDGETGRILTEDEVDRLRDKRGYLKELKDTPEKYIERLESGYVEPEQYDPYYNDPKDIINDRKNIKKT